MKLKVRDNKALENKSIEVTILAQYKFPLWFFEDKEGIVSIHNKVFEKKINEQLEHSLFSDSFGKIPAIYFSVEKIDYGQIDAFKQNRIKELKAELSALTGESQ